MIFTFAFRIFLIVSDFSKFHKEVNYLKDVLKNNYFPTTLVDKCIKMFLNKQFAHKMVEHTVSKKELFLVLPYLGMSFFRLKTRLQKVSKSNISFCKIKIIFKSSVRLSNFFGLKIRCVYALTLLMNLRAVDAMLPIMAKHAGIST